jgi:hypothetical protein
MTLATRQSSGTIPNPNDFSKMTASMGETSAYNGCNSPGPILSDLGAALGLSFLIFSLSFSAVMLKSTSEHEISMIAMSVVPMMALMTLSQYPS